MTKAYEEMLEALRTSVLEIVAADGSDRDAELKKSFDEFDAALKGRLDEDVPLSIEGTDPVSLMGSRLGLLGEAVDAIEHGLVKGGNTLHEDSLMLAKGVLELGSLMLSACAADFAEPAEEDETLAKGVGLYKVPTTAGEVLMKSALPEEAALLTADKGDVADKLAEFFFEGLDWLGVDLSKKAPPWAKKGDDDEADDDEGGEEDTAAGAEDQDEDDADTDPDESDAPEGGEGEGSPLENISRLSALALLELDNIKQQLGPDAGGEDPEGGLSALDAIGQHLALAVVSADALSGAVAGAEEDPAAMDPNADPSASMQGQEPGAGGQDEAPAGEGDDADLPIEDDEAEKNTPAGELAKARKLADKILAKADDATKRAEQAEARAAEAERKLADLQKAEGAKPADPKAGTGVGATVMTKVADGGSADGETEAQQRDRLTELAKRDPALAATEMIKAAYRHPIRVT